LSSVSRPNRII